MGLENGPQELAGKVVKEGAKLMGMTVPFAAADILAANPNINFLFAFELFLLKPGLALNEAGLLKDDESEEREERCTSIRFPLLLTLFLVKSLQDVGQLAEHPGDPRQ